MAAAAAPSPAIAAAACGAPSWSTPAMSLSELADCFCWRTWAPFPKAWRSSFDFFEVAEREEDFFSSFGGGGAL